MNRTFVLAAALLGFVGVAAGAFGTHALRDTLTARDLEIFETAVRYQLVHAVALLGIAAAAARWTGVSGIVGFAGWSMIAGVIVFSGSLYALVGTGVRALGAVTPLGGVGLLFGWAALAWAAIKAPSVGG
jgi:uncharacterized membrane protein YgdD (TMEM256/DUF423 family)